MKTKIEKPHQPPGQPRRPRTVHLELAGVHAEAVALAGTFNDWKPETTPLARIGPEHWAIGLALPAGQYEYLFVADGRWLPDPNCLHQVPNPFGGVNSVLSVGSPKEPRAMP
jgi:1,4-alpha-glucan branching enzyme